MSIGGRQHILALVTDAFGGRGGIAQYNRDFLSAAAATRAVEKITVLPRLAPDIFTPPAKIRQRAPGGRLAYVFRALKMALTRKFDVIYCGHINLAPLALMAARLCGARLVIQMHGIEAWNRPGPRRRRAVEAADLILCVSRHTRARVLQWAAIAPERVIVLPNTVGVDFKPGDGTALRAAWGLEGKTILLTVARMDSRERYKGHEKVMAAMAALPAHVVYVVLGDGDDRTRLQQMAAGLGLADRVHFKGGPGRDILVQAYRMADLYVMPSTGEGFGIAFLEAMASGTPALGLAVAGAADALGDGTLSMAVTESEFAPALRRALEDPRPDGAALSNAVLTRFGQGAFQAGVEAMLHAHWNSP